MQQPTGGCAVCGSSEPHGLGMSRVVIEGRALTLCRAHAATVASAMPATFEDLRNLFLGAAIDVDLLIRLDTMVERRSPISRRGEEDRRAFPPRPEGRRMAFGRRATDPFD